MAQAFTVLIVDDDPLVRGSVVGIIEARGFRVVAAESAIEATRILAQRHVDVLFTDIVMPGTDGIELAKQAKRMQPGIQIMFSTGYFSRAADALRVGKLLTKPMRAAQIETALQEVLYHSRDFRPRVLDSGPYQI
ncbi:MAG TPA: response regulator [Stellaceae bacterium]|nr:response regulator [Stellaceae bacterium]